MKRLIYRIGYFLLIFTVLLVSNMPVKGQWSASVTLDQEYNDNPFRNPQAQPGWITNVNGKLQHDWNRFAFRYFSSFFKFNLLPERNFYWHQLAFWGGSDTLNYGATIDQRINRNEYSFYNYMSRSVYLNYRTFVSGVWLMTTNYLFWNNYSRLEQLNNWQFNSNVRINKAFQTKTSLIGSFGLYVKKYSPNGAQTVLIGIDSISVNQSPKANGHGRNRGYYLSPVYESIPSASPSVAQIAYPLRIAQSITATTGLAVQVKQRILIKGFNRYVFGLSYDYSGESQLFEDPMGYESLSTGLELTKLLPFNLTLKAAYYNENKDYISQGIYLNSEYFDDQTLRKDSFQTAWFSLGKRIFFSKISDHGIFLHFNFQWINNSSNSYWYHYHNNSWSVGLNYFL